MIYFVLVLFFLNRRPFNEPLDLADGQGVQANALKETSLAPVALLGSVSPAFPRRGVCESGDLLAPKPSRQDTSFSDFVSPSSCLGLSLRSVAPDPTPVVKSLGALQQICEEEEEEDREEDQQSTEPSRPETTPKHRLVTQAASVAEKPERKGEEGRKESGLNKLSEKDEFQMEDEGCQKSDTVVGTRQWTERGPHHTQETIGVKNMEQKTHHQNLDRHDTRNYTEVTSKSVWNPEQQKTHEKLQLPDDPEKHLKDRDFRTLDGPSSTFQTSDSKLEDAKQEDVLEKCPQAREQRQSEDEEIKERVSDESGTEGHDELRGKPVQIKNLQEEPRRSAGAEKNDFQPVRGSEVQARDKKNTEDDGKAGPALDRMKDETEIKHQTSDEGASVSQKRAEEPTKARNVSDAVLQERPKTDGPSLDGNQSEVTKARKTSHENENRMNFQINDGAFTSALTKRQPEELPEPEPEPAFRTNGKHNNQSVQILERFSPSTRLDPVQCCWGQSDSSSENLEDNNNTPSKPRPQETSVILAPCASPRFHPKNHCVDLRPDGVETRRCEKMDEANSKPHQGQRGSRDGGDGNTASDANKNKNVNLRERLLQIPLCEKALSFNIQPTSKEKLLPFAQYNCCHVL